MGRLELEKLMKGASFLYKIFPNPSHNYISFSIRDIYTVSPVPWQIKGFVEGARSCELRGHPLNPFEEDGTFEVELVRLRPEYYAFINIGFERDIKRIYYISLETKKKTSGDYVFYRMVYFDTLKKYTRYSTEDFIKLLDRITNNHLSDESRRILYELKVIPTIIMTTIHSLLNFPSPDIEVIGDSKWLSDVTKSLEDMRNILKGNGDDPVEILSNTWLGDYFI